MSLIDYLFIFLVLLLFIQVFYFFYFFRRLSIIKTSQKNIFFPEVSIIICAKNESKNLKANLPIILNQNYNTYEVIVVDDQSQDETKYILKDLAEKHPNLKVVNINQNINYKKGKKFALTLGIKTAKFEHLLLTDADCKPISKSWISYMIQNLENKEIILGYSNYEKKPGLLNKLIRFDTFSVAMQYLSFSLANKTYMGVGRNLSYKKSLFFRNKGFASHIHLVSGDDDLFIQEVATKDNVGISIAGDSHTTSEVIKDWKSWIYQKRRHITTSKLYKRSFKFLLSLWPLSNVLFLKTIVVLLILNKPSILIILAILFIRLVISYSIFYPIMQRLKVKDLFWLHPVYEILYLFIQGFFVLLNGLNKPKEWA